MITENAITPVGEVETGIAVDVEVGRLFDVLENILGDRETGLKGGQLVCVEFIGRPVAREQGVIPILREAGFAQVKHPGTGAATVVGEGRGQLIDEAFIQAGVARIREGSVMEKTRIPALAVIGVIAGEHVERRGNPDIDDITGHHRVSFQLGAIGAHPENTAALQGDARTIATLGAVHIL